MGRNPNIEQSECKSKLVMYCCFMKSICSCCKLGRILMALATHSFNFIFQHLQKGVEVEVQKTVSPILCATSWTLDDVISQCVNMLGRCMHRGDRHRQNADSINFHPQYFQLGLKQQ